MHLIEMRLTSSVCFNSEVCGSVTAPNFVLFDKVRQTLIYLKGSKDTFVPTD